MKTAKQQDDAPSETVAQENGKDDRGIPSKTLQTDTDYRRQGIRHISRVRKVPIVRFLLYYVAIVAAGAGLSYLSPLIHHAFIAPIVPVIPAASQAGDLLRSGMQGPPPAVVETFTGPYDRAMITAMVILGAFALALPIAWVARFTQRLKYDPALIQSIVILPIVVAGIVILVKNSLALAFSLAGIVAVVRFRNTLKDPKDAVYIFLVLGIGLAAGVQALDVALIVSLAFNLLVLGMWKFDAGSFYTVASGGGLLTIGDVSLLPLGGMREHPRVRERAEKLANDMDTDGYLLIYTTDVTAARSSVEIAMTEYASNWRVGALQAEAGGLYSFIAVVNLRQKAGGPVELLGDLEERFLEQIAAAEYVPFKRESDKSREDDDE